MALLAAPVENFVAVDQTHFRLEKKTAAVVALMDTPDGRLVAALRAWEHRKTMNPFAYHHSLAVAVLFVVAAAYLTWWGIIPYLSWA